MHLVGNLLQIVLFNQLKGGTFIQLELLFQNLKQNKEGQTVELMSPYRIESHHHYQQLSLVIPCSHHSSCLPGKDLLPSHGRTAAGSKTFKSNKLWAESRHIQPSNFDKCVVHTNHTKPRQANTIFACQTSNSAHSCGMPWLPMQICHVPCQLVKLAFQIWSSSHIVIHEGTYFGIVTS